ncbi:20S proteasome alpha subunit 3 [Spironucleus salmonicida]|uniref:Proteasome subunit alpha type n=1 Tax=Spironucleus salmonicida TaxID=348837 RepID=V6LHW9_9EUKA|nr:20S proteasome alpha subunit 3 [Spironucleus salmonicida]|eukprot:EST43908.1 20S proteasome alpha subunit 3 [Spironucleus salmonicida]
MSKYDFSTTTFSDEGRLHQVEYAIKAVATAPTILAVNFNSQILIAAHKRIPALFAQKRTEKLLQLDKSVYIAVSGVLSDANVLIEEGRLFAQEYFQERGQRVPLQRLSVHMADIMQTATQYGGLRPYGVGALLLGAEGIYQIDPSGNVAKWQAAAVGKASGDVNAKIKQLIKDGITDVAQLKKIGVQSLSKGVEKEDLNKNGVELALISFDKYQGSIEYINDDEIEQICKQVIEDGDREEDNENSK